MASFSFDVYVNVLVQVDLCRLMLPSSPAGKLPVMSWNS